MTAISSETLKARSLGPFARQLRAILNSMTASLRFGGADTDVNYLEVSGAAASSPVAVRAKGTDTNVDLVLSGQAAGVVRIGQVATAGVNYVEVDGSAASSPPTVRAKGTDTNVDLVLSGQAAGVLRLGQVATAGVNYIQVAGAAAASMPAIAAVGTDTDIDLVLTPKGTGNVRFGTFTGSGDVAVNGSVLIKDAAGNARKLATVA